MRVAGDCLRMSRRAACLTVMNRSGSRPAAASAAMLATTPLASDSVTTNGIVRWKNRMPGKFASSALPRVSAVTPVLSETKYAARVGATGIGWAGELEVILSRIRRYPTSTHQLSVKEVQLLLIR